MYREFYGLREEPFSLTPDPEFFFMSAGHKQALSSLSYGILQRKGFMLLSGEVGSGKTMIIRRLLEELGDAAVTAYVLNPADTFTGLLRFILRDLDIPAPSAPDASKSDLLDTLYQFLLARGAEGLPVIIIFDEAQTLSQAVLEDIRLISNFETTKDKLIQIVFVGQPELRDMVAAPELRQLAQRIAVKFHLGPLTQAEMDAYVDHRLHIAGGDRVHFTLMAKDVMYNYTGGVPRLVNLLGDYALLVGYVNETFVLNHRILTEAITELEGRAGPTAEIDQTEQLWMERLRQRRRRRRGRRIRRARHGGAGTPEAGPQGAPADGPDAGVLAPAAEGRAGPDGVPPEREAPEPAVAVQMRPVLTAPAPTNAPEAAAVLAEPAGDARAEAGAAGTVPPAADAPAAPEIASDAGPAPSLGDLLREQAAPEVQPAGHPGGRDRPWQRRVVSADEASSLATQALERGRQQGDADEDADAGPLMMGTLTEVPGDDTSTVPLIGDLPENWWQFAKADDRPGTAAGGWGGRLGRLGRALFGWLR